MVEMAEPIDGFNEQEDEFEELRDVGLSKVMIFDGPRRNSSRGVWL